MSDNSNNFMTATRMKYITLAPIVKPSGGGLAQITLPKANLLSALHLTIRGTVTDTTGMSNTDKGFSTLIKRVRLQTQSAIDIVNVSGAGYHYLLRDMLDTELINVVPASNARTDMTAGGTFNLDMYIPLTINRKDPVGLILLQNEAIVVTLAIEFETGGVYTCTVTPTLETFTVPVSDKDIPDLSVLVQTLENTENVSASGDYTYTIPRGGVYLQVAHGLDFVWSTGEAERFTRVRTRANQSDYWQDLAIEQVDTLYGSLRGRTRHPRTLAIDYLATSGLGNYGTPRDIFNSRNTTSFEHVLTVNASGLLTTVRRQIITP